MHLQIYHTFSNLTNIFTTATLILDYITIIFLPDISRSTAYFEAQQPIISLQHTFQFITRFLVYQQKSTSKLVHTFCFTRYFLIQITFRTQTHTSYSITHYHSTKHFVVYITVNSLKEASQSASHFLL